MGNYLVEPPSMSASEERFFEDYPPEAVWEDLATWIEEYSEQIALHIKKDKGQYTIKTLLQVIEECWAEEHQDVIREAYEESLRPDPDEAYERTRDEC